VKENDSGRNSSRGRQRVGVSSRVRGRGAVVTRGHGHVL
jgi:hypothetical protein